MAVQTPSLIGTYQHVMTAGFDEQSFIGNPTAFQSIFDSPMGETVFSPDAESIDLAIQRGDETIAKLITRGVLGDSAGSNQSESLQSRWTEIARVFPLIEEVGPLTATQFNKRIPGEAPYSPLSKQARARFLARRLHNIQMKKIIRKFEVLAAQMFRTGVMNINEGGTDTIGGYRDSNMTATLTNQWSDTTNGTPLADLLTGCENVRKLGHAVPDRCLMGSDAFQYFIAHPTVTTAADNRRLSFQSLGKESPVMPAKYQSLVDSGMTYQGWLKVGSYELYVFTYPEYYEATPGTKTPYLPDAEVTIDSTNGIFDRAFGPHEYTDDEADAIVYRSIFGLNPIQGAGIMPMGVKNPGLILPAMFMPSATKFKDKAYEIKMEAAPIFWHRSVDTVYRITNAG